jgi:hypothetical protein
MDLLVGIRHIDLGSIFLSGQTIHNGSHVWHWRYIEDRIGITIPRIYDGSQGTILLCYAKKGARHYRRSSDPPTGVLVSLSFLVKLLFK